MENKLYKKSKEILEGLRDEITYVTWFGDIKLYIYREDYFGNLPRRTKIKGLIKSDGECLGCSIDIDMNYLKTLEDFRLAIEFTLNDLVRNLTNHKYGVRL